jgi:hypothetical protein
VTTGQTISVILGQELLIVTKGDLVTILELGADERKGNRLFGALADAKSDISSAAKAACLCIELRHD